ncbi:MAG: hypothetical protein APR63_03095 [Desulfuromonas sp. SDB]|nr:MAG: hypothetical protein APR63_03095 [Desulfuromonas sp. SDB]
MISRYFHPEHLMFNMNFEHKQHLFEYLCKKAEQDGFITSWEKMYKAVAEREQQGITELKSSVVLPHARGDFITRLFTYFVVNPQGISYQGIKGDKAKLVIFIGIPPQDKDYLKLLAAISRILSKPGFFDQLLRAEVIEDAVYTFKKYYLQVGEQAKGETGYAVVLNINGIVDVDEILPLMTEVGINNVVVMEGEQPDSPFKMLKFFSSFSFRRSGIGESRLFMGLTSDSDASGKLFTLLKNEGTDLSRPGKGYVFSFALNQCFGGVEEEPEF